MDTQNLQLGMLSIFEKLANTNTTLNITLKNEFYVIGTLKYVDKSFNLFLENV